jgi:outer membrane receptor protein involved in Fe transport
VRYNVDEVSLISPSGNLLDKTQTNTAPMNGTIVLSQVFSPTMFNNVQLGMNRIWALTHTDSHLFDTTGIFNSVSLPGFDKLNQKADAVKAPTTYTIKDDFTWTRGLHTLKAGVEIKRVVYNYSQASENALVYASLTGFAANQLDQVNLIGGVPTHGLLKTEYFSYVQDTWKLRPELTVNLGLRYEFFHAFHEKFGRDLPFDLATCADSVRRARRSTFPRS